MKACLPRLLLLLATAGAVRAADLTVELTGMRNDKGVLRVALFGSAAGFPMDASRAIATRSVAVASLPTNRPGAVVFRDLPLKTYAVSVFHDEDSDGKLKTHWFGMPDEGVGTSNNAKGRIGPPRFQSAAFALQGDMRILVRIAYLQP